MIILALILVIPCLILYAALPFTVGSLVGAVAGGVLSGARAGGLLWGGLCGGGFFVLLYIWLQCCAQSA